MTSFIVKASAFLLAAAASLTTFGGNAILARHQFATAEHIAAASGAVPRKSGAAVVKTRHA